MNRKLILCLVSAAMCSTTWGWSGTVINVNRTNTVSDYNDPWWKTTGNDSIPLWRERTGFGLAEGEALPATATDVVSGGEIYQARDSWGDVAGLDWCTLKSTPITLPNDGLDYYILVFFWSDEVGSPWRIRAALSEAGLAYYLFIGGANPLGPTTPIQVGLDDAGRVLWAAIIAVLEGQGQDIVIYTDDAPTDNANERTWLDAYGYEPVSLIPRIPGDLNYDWKVDFKDVALLSLYWLTIYDYDELADIADHWLEEYP